MADVLAVYIYTLNTKAVKSRQHLTDILKALPLDGVRKIDC